MTVRATQIIGWSELLGGAVGLCVLLPVAAHQGVVALGVGYYGGAALGFLLAMAAGWRLLRERTYGRGLSLLVQALQVVQVTAAGWMFQYATGLQVLVVMAPGVFQVSPGVNAAVWLGPTLVPVEWRVAINLFALWAAFMLALRRPARPSEQRSATSAEEVPAGSASGRTTAPAA